MNTIFDWSRYAVGGAASRPDSFTGLNPDYAARVAQLVQAADAELGPRALTITSAYRSPEVQARLYADAIAKYGSPEAARRWVAPPGHSMHNKGLAVDFADSEGRMLRDANSREAQWIAANAERFGLAVPMSWEPWQVELAGARSRPAGGAPVAAPEAPLTFGNRAPSAGVLPVSMGEAAPENKLGILAEIGAGLMPQQQQQAPQLLPFTPTAYQPQKRDRAAPYLQFLQSLG